MQQKCRVVSKQDPDSTGALQERSTQGLEILLKKELLRGLAYGYQYG